MINPFILSPMEQIRIWRELRDALDDKNTQERLKLISDYWWQAPIVTFCLDYDKPETWPTPWEVVYFNGYDTTARALMMAETFILYNELYMDSIELLYIKDFVEEDLLMILVVEGHVLNHQYKRILTLDELAGHYTIINRYYKDSAGWKITNA